jgi:hypothetical protein
MEQQEQSTGRSTPVATRRSKLIQPNLNKEPMPKNQHTIDLTRESPPPKATPIVEETRATRKKVEQKKNPRKGHWQVSSEETTSESPSHRSNQGSVVHSGEKDLDKPIKKILTIGRMS